MKDKKIIRLSKSCLGAEEKTAVMAVLEDEFLGMGKRVKQFEDELQKFFGRRAVCVNTGTSAIQLALQACGIGQGDEVLVPSITYLASFQAVSATGAKPIACDVEEHTLGLCPVDMEKRINPKTKAVIPVHYGGHVGAIDEINQLADQYGLRVIEDACHAFGTVHQGKKIGSQGDVACFSFDGIKNITSGEGGCIVSNDHKVIDKIKDLRLLGVQNDSEKRYENTRSWDFEVVEQGWRYHMSEIMGAIGLEQLKKFPVFSSTRKRLVRHYEKQLEDLPGMHIIPVVSESIVPHIMPVLLPQGILNHKIRQYLLEFGIQTGWHYKPNHLLHFYNDGYSLKTAESAAARQLTLPLHPDLSEEDVNYVVKVLKELV